jgi:branched-chain amino acid transport system ATP-binding protein
MRVVMNLADHVDVIDRGTKIAEGTAAEVQRDRAVIAAYLGSSDTPAPEKAATVAGPGGEGPVRRRGSTKVSKRVGA